MINHLQYFADMKMGHYARRTLLPALMYWVEQSRLSKSLPSREYRLIRDLGDGFLEINLNYLGEDYIRKHVERDMKKYCDAFTQQITPVLKAWCIKGKVREAKIFIRFEARFVFNTSVEIKTSPQELSENTVV